MRVPALLRTTPFRLTVLFLALFAASAAAFLAYIYVATVGEVTRRADADIGREISALQAVYDRGGGDALNQALIQRTLDNRPYLYLLSYADGRTISGNLASSPVDRAAPEPATAHFRTTDVDPNGTVTHSQGQGRQVRLSSGDLLFVGADVGEGQASVLRIVRAIWGAGVLVLLLGLAGGLVVSRNVSRSLTGLNRAVAAVAAGDLRARAPVRGVRDEYDELAGGLNAMLDRVERLMGGLRHAGDAIAHDLRSPLTRLRVKLETGLMDVEAGHADPHAALANALADSDMVLRTFDAVLAISRLQAAGQVPNPQTFDLAEVAQGVAELYEPVCEERGLDFGVELGRGLTVRGDKMFLGQALANMIDNAAKYTPSGGAVMLRTRRRSSGEIELSLTDTGPGIPEADRPRVVERFVRLDNSRHAPGSGLGLSLIAAVADVHGGRLELDEGPGVVGDTGPGLRAVIVLPAAP